MVLVGSASSTAAVGGRLPGKGRTRERRETCCFALDKIIHTYTYSVQGI